MARKSPSLQNMTIYEDDLKQDMMDSYSIHSKNSINNTCSPNAIYAAIQRSTIIAHPLSPTPSA